MRSLCVATIIGACLGLAGIVSADTIYVAQDGSGDYTSIQSALDVAQDGDEILIFPGTYYERPAINGKSLSLIGVSGRDVTIIDGSSGGRTLEITGYETFSLEGLTIQRGRFGGSTSGVTYEGGGLYASGGSLTMRECALLKSRLYKSAASNQTVYLVGAAAKVYGQLFFIDNYVAGNGFEFSGNGYAISSLDVSGVSHYERSRFDGNDSGLRTANYSIIDSSYLGDDGNSLTSCYIYNSIICFAPGNYVGFGNLFSCSEAGTLGACCAEEFGCQVMSHKDCFDYAMHPRFGGPGSECDTPECTTYDPYGACCVAGGCGYMRQTACDAVGGDWHGDYVPCESVSCPVPPAVGSCCVVEACIQVTEEACTLAEGRWQGDLVPCADADCLLPPETGSCCVGGACLEVTQAECFEAKGIFAGELTTCDTTDCPSVCAGDVNLDGTVDVNDILLMLGSYGPCP